MKKFFILAALCCLITLTSCQKSGMNLFRGEYSYKISGTVILAEQQDGISILEPDEFETSLSNEIGQMEITTLDKDEDLVMVTMNTMNGEVIVANASVKDDKIVFDDFTRRLKIIDTAHLINMECEVKVKAKGKMFDDNTMIVNMTYEGKQKYLGKTFKISGDNIIMAAQRN
jgi:hypothetical protein